MKCKAPPNNRMKPTCYRCVFQSSPASQVVLKCIWPCWPASGLGGGRWAEGGCGDSRRDSGPYHGRQGQRRQAQGRLGAGHGLPPVPLDGLIGRVGRPRCCKWGKRMTLGGRSLVCALNSVPKRRPGGRLGQHISVWEGLQKRPHRRPLLERPQR